MKTLGSYDRRAEATTAAIDYLMPVLGLEYTEVNKNAAWRESKKVFSVTKRKGKFTVNFK